MNKTDKIVANILGVIGMGVALTILLAIVRIGEIFAQWVVG